MRKLKPSLLTPKSGTPLHAVAKLAIAQKEIYTVGMHKQHKPALLLMAYGTPGSSADIEAYYTDIRRGHPPTPAQLKELQDRYTAIGGTTPLRTITEAQAEQLAHLTGVKTYIGMKHWRPYIHDAVAEMSHDGITHIVALVLAPHFSSMSVADYRSRLHSAVAEIHPAVHVDSIERWGSNPVFIDSICDRLEETRTTYTKPDWDDIEVVFSAHSLPERILESGDPYRDELMETCKLVAGQLHIPHWRLAFQSAGRTDDAWIGPDILSEMRSLAAKRVTQVLVAPIGFVTDNLEILYDLDIQTAALAKELGIEFRRIPTANATRRFIEALSDVVAPYIAAGVHQEN